MINALRNNFGCLYTYLLKGRKRGMEGRTDGRTDDITKTIKSPN